jgi:hypothetical protein
MSTPVISDAALEAMLAWRADRADPGDLRETAFAMIEATPPRRGWLAWPATLLGGPTRRPLVLVLAAAGLLLAALAGALVAGRLLDTTRSTQLQPTGIEVLTPESTTYDRVVVDGTGAAWAVGSGHLTRFDPATGEHRTWTVADDPAFGEQDPSMLAPAAQGGVWMLQEDLVRRFDGTAFCESIPAPGDGPIPWVAPRVPSLATAPDGALWSMSLRHWDGSVWVDPPVGGPDWYESGLERRAAAGQQSPRVPVRDGVWVASGTAVGHLAGGRWTTYGPADTGLAGNVQAIVEAADRSIWLLGPEGRLVRFDGRAWTAVESPGFDARWLVPAPAGSVWAAGNDATIVIASYDAGRWTAYGTADGLRGTLRGIAGTPAGVFAITSAGVFRFADGRWLLGWPPAQVGPVAPQQILPVSRDEAWVVDPQSLWHYRDGRWDGPMPLPAFLDVPDASIAAVLGSDGSVWVNDTYAVAPGAAVLRDGTWQTVAPTSRGLGIGGIDAHGTAWASDGTDGGVVSIGSDPSVTVRRFQCPNPATHVAVASDGSVYVGGATQDVQPGGATSAGLSRIDGTACNPVEVPGDLQTRDVWALATGPDAQVAAAVSGGLGRVMLFDGTRWTTLDLPAAVPTPAPSTAPSASADASTAPAAAGSWQSPVDLTGLRLLFDAQGRLGAVPADPGQPVQWFDGLHWIPAGAASPPADPTVLGRWVAPDGGTWLLGSSGIERISQPGQ